MLGHCLGVWIMEIPDSCFEWRNPLDLPPLAAFDLPRNHERPPRTALGKYVFQGVQRSRMAGHLPKPTFVEFCEWCQMDGSERASNESGHIVELLIQMYPVERKTFVANSGVTTYEFARTYRDCGITARRAAPHFGCSHTPRRAFPNGSQSPCRNGMMIGICRSSTPRRWPSWKEPLCDPALDWPEIQILGR